MMLARGSVLNQGAAPTSAFVAPPPNVQVTFTIGSQQRRRLSSGRLYGARAAVPQPMVAVAAQLTEEGLMSMHARLLTHPSALVRPAAIRRGDRRVLVAEGHR